MLMFRRILSLTLALVLMAGMLPPQAFAAETETAPVPEETIPSSESAPLETAAEETVPETTAETASTEATEETQATAATEAVTEPAVQEAVFVGEDVYFPEDGEGEELYEGFLNQLFFGDDTFVTLGILARERLSKADRYVYDELKYYIQLIAKGSRSSTKVTVNLSGTGYSDSDVYMPNAVNALRHDCPYDTYWLGGYSVLYYSASETYEIKLLPRANYRPSNFDSQNPTIKNSEVSKAVTAANNAKAIVQQYASYTDYNKLAAYADKICSLVKYDYDAANNATYDTNINPWTLVNIFDNDTSTNAVCEGYAEAFQYLCDMSDFDGKVECYSPSGADHKWNIVRIEGVSFLMDVTHCDDGTKATRGAKFLGGGSGSVKDGYVIGGFHYWYYEDTLAMWGTGENSILKLSPKKYDPKNPPAPGKTMSQTEFEAALDSCGGSYRLTKEVTLTSGLLLDGVALTIGSGGMLVVSPDVWLKIMDNASITVQTGGKLIVDSNGALFPLGSLVKSGGTVTESGSICDTAVEYVTCLAQFREDFSAAQIRRELSRLEKEDIADAMAEDIYGNEIVGDIAALEEKAGGPVAAKAEENACGFETRDISAIGANLNMPAYSGAAMTLVLGDAKKTYNGAVGSFSLRLQNASKETALTFPIQVTLEMPYKLADDKLALSRYGADGTKVAVPVNWDSYDTVIFSVSELGDFVLEFPLSGTCGDNLTWRFDGASGKLTISGKGKMTDYSSWESAPWYPMRDSIQEVVISSGVTSIGNEAFSSCKAMKSIRIPEGVTSIGDYGFSNCERLQTLDLPESLLTLGIQVFNGCESLTEVTLPGKLKGIPVNGFANCTSLKEITLPDGLTTISSQAFWNDENLTRITIPASVTFFGSSAFKNCTALKYVTFEGDAPEFQVYDTYSNFLNVTATVYYPAGNATWTEAVRQNYGGNLTWVSVCTDGHTEVIQPGTAPTCTEGGISEGRYCSVCGIVLKEQTALDPLGHQYVDVVATAPTCTEDGCTAGCRCSRCGLVVVPWETIPATGHTPATDEAVEPTCVLPGWTEGSHCAVCQEVLIARQEIPATGHTFENSFCIICGAPDILEGTCGRGLSWVLDGYGNLTITGSGKMNDNPWAQNAGRIKTVTVGEGVTNIYYKAFENCANLTEVSLPDTLTEIDSYAFQKCPGLTEIVIPRGVETIGSGAFLECTGLTGIVIPEGVTELGSWAFENCTNLASVKLPSTLSTLESYLFRECSSLTEVVVPEGVTEMWNCVFWGCTALKRVQLPETLTEMSYGIFDSCVSLEEVNLPSRLKVIDEHLFSGCESLKRITIPKTVTTIGKSAFWGTGLTEVTVSAAVTEIGVGAFSNCQDLTGITVASGNRMYSNDAHGALYNKQKTVLCQIPGGFTGTFPVPGTVAVIGERAAAFCRSLTGIAIAQGVTTIGNSAFFRSGLKEIILPASVDLIDKYAFEECSALTDVTICGSNTAIKESAFDLNTALQNIWFKGDAPSFDAYVFYDVTATAHYPAGNPTWTEAVRQSYGGTITWEPQYEVEEVSAIQADKKNLYPGETLLLTAVLDPGVRQDVEILWALEASDDARTELIADGLSARLVCHEVTKRTTVTVKARTAEGSEVPAEVSITLRPEGQVDADFTLFSGKSLQMTAYNPENGKYYKNNEVTWQLLAFNEAGDLVEPDAFATISKTGKITAKKVYETVRLEVSRTVIATGDTVSCLVDILPAVTQAEVRWNGDVVNGKTLLMDFSEKGRTFDLAVYPEDTVAAVTWSVSDKKQQYADYAFDETALTISNPKGKSGTVTVKATVDAGVKKTVTFKIQLASYAKTVEITGPEDAALKGGETLKLSAAITEPEIVTKSGILWSVSDKTAATVSGGTVKAKNVLQPTTVTVTATSKDGRASDSIAIRILPKNEGTLVLKDGGTFITNAARNLNLGDSVQVTACSVIQGECVEETVVWSSSKPSVAAVDRDGRITAVSNGTAKITAQAYGNRKASITIKVMNLAQQVLLSTKDGKNLVEENGQLTAVVSSGKGIQLTAAVAPANAGNKVAWEITEGGIWAKITAAGKLTAAKDLTDIHYITVRATARDGSAAFAELRVKVLPIAQGVQIFESGSSVRSNTVYVCDMLTTPVLHLKAKVFPAKADQTVQLTSSNKKIADFVDGELVCYKPGSVTITAKALDGSNQKTTFKLTVVKKVQSLTLKEGSSLTVVGGKNLKLAPMVQISPSDATNKKLSWSAAPNPYGVTISTAGVLSTRKVPYPVTVNIMVTTQDGSGILLSFDVTVKPA